MNYKDNFQILRDERTKLVNEIADLQTENIRLREAIPARLRKQLQLHQAVKAVIEDSAFNLLAPETQAKLKKAEIPIGGWSAALERVKAFLAD